MNNQWFVYDGVQQKGPFPELTISEMVANGIITEQTYLWTEGLANWIRYRESPFFTDPLPQPVTPNILTTYPAVNQWQNSTITNTPQTYAAVNQWQNSTTNSATQVIKLKKMPWLLTWFLTAITFGIYSPSWFLSRRRALNSLQSNEKLNAGVFVFGLVGYSLGIIILFISGMFEGMNQLTPDAGFKAISEALEGVGNLLYLSVAITLLVQCFKVRRILRDHFNDYLGHNIFWSGVGVFFFHILYLQYKINQLEYEKSVATGRGVR